MIYRILRSTMFDPEYNREIRHPVTGTLRIDGDRARLEYRCSDFDYVLELRRDSDGHFRGEKADLRNPGKNYAATVSVDLEISVERGEFTGVHVENGNAHDWAGELEPAL